MEFTHLITLLGLGLVLGLKHALDADHVIAVSTIVSRTRSIRKSSLYGLMWGLGHTLTLLLVGVIILSFKLKMPEKIALGFEFLVGIVLVLLGLDVLQRIRRERIHAHKHKHDGITHVHLHSHNASDAHGHSHRSLLVGMVHGLAGSAALTLLVLATAKSVLKGVLYIVAFGAGSIIGMLIISTAIGLPFVYAARFERFSHAIGAVAGMISILLGGIIMYEIGYVQNLIF